MERAYSVFGDARYERLAAISVAHLYNLRSPSRLSAPPPGLDQDAAGDDPHRRTTRLSPKANQPGYLRADSVHQGDQDGVKGVYHINAVDCVTQYEGVASFDAHLAKAFLIPVRRKRCSIARPFVIKG